MNAGMLVLTMKQLVASALQSIWAVVVARIEAMDTDDKDSLLDLVESWALGRATAKPEKRALYDGLFNACQAYRKFARIPDDDTDQLKPV